MHQLDYFFFFQAEDGIRDKLVTGVQTCALPICELRRVQHDRLHLCACDLREAELREELPGGLSEQIHRAYAAAPGEIEGGQGERRPEALSAALRRHGDRRSEEHTSELQSLAYLVCRLLLEKKKR